MGLAKNLAEWETAMKMQQLPLFNTAYADRDGHIMYVYNATLPVHPTGDYRFWQGVVPGDRSDLIATAIHPWEAVPKVLDPPTGWVQNSNDMPWTSVYPMVLDSTKFAAGFAAPQGITQRAQRGIRILSTAPEKMTFEDIKKGKLDTHVETADQFVDEIVTTARSMGSERAKKAADVLASWDRQAETGSEGTLLFYKFMTAAGQAFDAIGGFKVPTDDRRPLETPRGFKDPAKAMALLDKVAGEVEKEYGTLAVKWGDVMRFRRGKADVPGNGAPSSAGRDSHHQRRPVRQWQDGGRLGRHLLRGHRVLDAAARGGAAGLRELVEGWLEARRGSAAAAVAQGDAADLAGSQDDRSEPGRSEGVLTVPRR